MITFVVILSIGIGVAAVGYVARLFVQDHRIDARGRDIRARVEEARYLRSSEGATTIRYRLSWRENGETRYVTGTETIPTLYSPRVQPGREVDIRYLDDRNLRFVFTRR